MNITPELVYWVTRADAARAFLWAAVVLGVAITVVSVGVYFTACEGSNSKYASEDCRKEYRRVSRCFLRIAIASVWLFVLSGVALVFVPTTRQLAAIYVVPVVASNENISKVGDAAGRLFTLATEWLDELRPERKGGAK